MRMWASSVRMREAESPKICYCILFILSLKMSLSQYGISEHSLTMTREGIFKKWWPKPKSKMLKWSLRCLLLRTNTSRGMKTQVVSHWEMCLGLSFFISGSLKAYLIKNFLLVKTSMRIKGTECATIKMSPNTTLRLRITNTCLMTKETLEQLFWLSVTVTT